MFENSKWIWHPRVEKKYNCHLLARKTINIPANIKRAVCLISADNAYELYANASWMGRGPVRSFPEWQYYDEYDVTEQLCIGDNVIAVHAYFHGDECPGPLKQVTKEAGLLVELKIELTDGKSMVLGSDETWKVLRAPQYEIDTGFVTWHRQDYKENYNAEEELISWNKLVCDEGDWLDAKEVACQPWKKLIPREIPYLTNDKVYPVNVFGHLSGSAYGFCEHDIKNPYAIISENEKLCEILPLHNDFEVQLIIDFGKPCVGRFHIDIADSSGGEILFSYGTSLNLTRLDCLRLRQGSQHYQPYERRFARYVMLTCRNLRSALKIKSVCFEQVAYPVEKEGAFSCSDSKINAIWATSCRTLALNMHDQYEDCPLREQTLYGGDLRISSLLAYYAFGDYKLARQSLVKLGRLQYEDGAIPNHGPVPTPIEGELKIIPEFPLLWLIAVYEYYLFSGDVSLVEELWGKVKGLLQWYYSWEDSRGLLKKLPDDIGNNFVDNLAGIHLDGQVLPVQVFYYIALQAAAQMGECMKDHNAAETANKHAESLLKAVNTSFWDDDRQLYIDCLRDESKVYRSTPDSEITHDYSKISHGMAFYGGLIPVERKGNPLDVITGKHPVSPIRTPYMNYYLTEALFRESRPDEAVRHIREYWGEMLDRGADTFWEAFDPQTPSGQCPDRMWSLCHAFSGGPVQSLSAHVLGVVPIEPGFRKIRIAPEVGDLQWAKGTVPTPLGEIKIAWFRKNSNMGFECDVSIPGGISIDFEMPVFRCDLKTVMVDNNAVEFEYKNDKALFSIHVNEKEKRYQIEI